MPAIYTTKLYYLLTTFTTFHQLLTLLTNFYILLPIFTTFYYLSPILHYFSLIKMVLFLFIYFLLVCTNTTVFLDVMLQALILCLSFFTSLTLLISLTSFSHMSNMNNSFAITILKIIIIKANIIKIYISMYSVKNITLSESALTTTISPLKNTVLSRSYLKCLT